jgi:hypothetical protein
MGEKIKMSWYKYAIDFDRRNVINHKIMYLEETGEMLTTLAKMVFQSATLAKQSNTDIITSKKITSYPILHEILLEADAIALDSPWKFAALCEEAVLSISNLVETLKIERKKMTEGDAKPKVEKGWVLDG